MLVEKCQPLDKFLHLVKIPIRKKLVTVFTTFCVSLRKCLARKIFDVLRRDIPFKLNSIPQKNQN